MARETIDHLWMIISLDGSRIRTLEQVRAVLNGARALDFAPTTDAPAMLVKTSAIPQQSRTSVQSNPSPSRRQKICLTPATMPVWLTPGATVVDVTTPRFDLPLLFMYEAFT